MPEYEGERFSAVTHRCQFCGAAMSVKRETIDPVEVRGRKQLLAYTVECPACGSSHQATAWTEAREDTDPVRPCPMKLVEQNGVMVAA